MTTTIPASRPRRPAPARVPDARPRLRTPPTTVPRSGRGRVATPDPQPFHHPQETPP